MVILNPTVMNVNEFNFYNAIANVQSKYRRKGKHWYDTWLGCVRFESFNEKTRQLIVQVPSPYVMEYIEEHLIEAMAEALKSAFGNSFKLGYRIVSTGPSFGDIATFLQRQRQGSVVGPVHIQIPNARQRLEEGMRYFLKDKPLQWIPGNHGYDRIVEWLTDNKNRGLLCLGRPGLGKSLICQHVLPVLLAPYGDVVCVSAAELHDKLEELKKARIVVVDDLGKEPRKHYGDIDNSFLELCDNSERTGNLIIITTNLVTDRFSDGRLAEGYPDDLHSRYGDAVFSRLQSITRVSVIEGEDLR